MNFDLTCATPVYGLQRRGRYAALPLPYNPTITIHSAYRPQADSHLIAHQPRDLLSGNRADSYHHRASFDLAMAKLVQLMPQSLKSSIDETLEHANQLTMKITILFFANNIVFKPSFTRVLLRYSTMTMTNLSAKMQQKIQLWDILTRLCKKPDADLLQHLMDKARDDLNTQLLPPCVNGMAPLICIEGGQSTFSLHSWNPLSSLTAVQQLTMSLKNIDEEILQMSFLIYDYLQITFN